MLFRYFNKIVYLKLLGFFMFVWNVGNVGCFLKVNMIVLNVMKKGLNFVVECRMGFYVLFFIVILIISRMYVIVVVKVVFMVIGLLNKKY